jgi:muramoyltetrapeptide carboxypeptidase
MEKAKACINALQSWGYEVMPGKTLGSSSSNYFSGSDRERLDDLQVMLDEPAVKAILFGRGGYGTGRIIDKVDFSHFEEHPKWLIGFSDITLLHAHVYGNYKIASMHAPMASAFNQQEGPDPFTQSIRHALHGDKIKYHCEPHPQNRKGEGVGELAGGNLSLLVNIIGTPSDFKTKGRILFLEDTGEYLYHIDRMLRQLDRSGKLEKLAGLIVGGFSEMKDTERPFGTPVYDMISDLVKKYDYPVCYGFPVGHEKENYALKLGLGYKLKVGKSRVSLEE